VDATTLGSLLALIGVLSGSVVAYLGKRGETTANRMDREFDQLQEERDGLRVQGAAKDARIAELLEQRVADQVEIARLRVKVIELGGDPL